MLMEKKTDSANHSLDNSSENDFSLSKMCQKLNSKIYEKVNYQRFTIRKKLRAINFNFITFLTILPFILGLLYFLKQKFNSKENQYFFEKNIPAFTAPTEKIHWDTVQYLLKPSLRETFSAEKSPDGAQRKKISDHEVRKTIKKNNVDFNTNYFSLNKKLFFNSLGQQKFVGNIKTNPVSISDSFNKLSDQIFKLESTIPRNNLNFLETFYFNLDELPAILDTFFSNSTFHPKNSQVNSLIFKNENKANPISRLKLKRKVVFSDCIAKTPYLLKNSLNSIQTLNTNLSQESQLQNNFTNDTFLNLRHQLYKDYTLIKKDLEKFFIETKIIPSLSENVESPKFVQQKNLWALISEIEETNPDILNNFLGDFDKKNLPLESISGRKMSSYKYPDMSTREVKLFLLQKNYFSKSSQNNFEFHFPSIFSSATDYKLSFKKFPSVVVYTKPVIFNDIHKNKFLYEGPALVLDIKNGLDWLSQPEQQNQSLRDWFNTYLWQFNPLVKSRENFFGFYESPEFKPKSLLSMHSFSWIENLSNNRNKFIPSNELHFFPYEMSVHVPFLTPQQWEQAYSTLKNKVDNQGDSKDQVPPIPLIYTQIQNPRTDYWQIEHFDIDNSKKSKMNKLTPKNSYSPLFEIGRTGKLDYENFTTFDTLVDKENFLTKLTTGQYQRTYSIYSKHQHRQPLFHALWEPLTSNFWFITSQLSFAFFVFRILKSLADNYGRELLVYLIDLVTALGFLDDQVKHQIQVLMGQREKGFRIIKKTTRGFDDIVGIETLLPEISEIVWFLRNSARDFSGTETLPKGILLTGPPGTGKTLLVQAIAGEAQVPVLALSGSSLAEPGESGAGKLQIVFEEARQLAPCIVFIDEIDTLGPKRQRITHNPIGDDAVEEMLQSLINPQMAKRYNEFLDLAIDTQSTSSSPTQQSSTMIVQPGLRKKHLATLMQLLIELNGIQARDGVVVIGATNRPEMLDEALLRPGRFDRVLQLALPPLEKRLDILKFYTKGLGYESSISWEYVAQRTAGFSAADLAALMNESSLKAILNQTTHTLETIEHGIERITVSEKDNLTGISRYTDSRSQRYQLLETRLAYYQAGKIILSHLLEHHPKTVVTHLWPRSNNLRSSRIAKNLQNYFLNVARRCELEHRVVGCYAGKAAEILFLQSFTKNVNRKQFSTLSSNLSSLGREDLIFAQRLISFMVEKWYLYSTKLTIGQHLKLPRNLNPEHYPDEMLDFFENLIRPFNECIEIPPDDLDPVFSIYDSQKYFELSWWQQQVSDQLEFAEENTLEWFRLYLPILDRRILFNPEIALPTTFYFSNNLLRDLKTSRTGQKIFFNLLHKGSRNYYNQINPTSNVSTRNVEKRKLSQILEETKILWNEIHGIRRDYQVHSLILQSFNKAFSILDQNRELLDRIAAELLFHKILRQPDISLFIDQFLAQSGSKRTSSSEVCLKTTHFVEVVPFTGMEESDISKQQQQPLIDVQVMSEIDEKKIKDESIVDVKQEREIKKNLEKNFIKVVDSGWGKNSRKKLSHWIDFKILKNQKINVE